MTDLDLIPARYQRRRSFHTRVGQVGMGVMGMLVLLIGARRALDHQIAARVQELEEIRFERAQAEHDRSERARIDGERRQIAQNLAVLEGLRGGIAAKKMFAVVDDALDENIWFRSFSFRREGEIVEGAPEEVATGYFIVIPREGADAPSRAWRLQTHMEILAEASDHSALAGFVRRLSERPEVEHARILSTQSSQAGDGGRVQFELAVVVRSQS